MLSDATPKKDGNGGADGGADDRKKEDKSKEDEQKGKNGDKQKKGDKSAKPTPKAPSSKSRSEARFTRGEWMTLMEDDMFSFGELQCLSELLMQDERQRWLRVASRFADITGRKVHPDDIREKFAEMGGMGQ